MNMITTTDGVRIFVRDWGPRDALPLVFHHGWPLTGEEWDPQLMFFLNKGYRVIAHDRRGHGRSDQTDHGNDMDTYAADVIAMAAALDLKGAVHIGHSTGGGEVTRYIARAEAGRVSKGVLIGAVPPLMLQTEANPGGLPMAVFDGIRAGVATNRSETYLSIASGPFYGFNRPGAEPSEALIRNWWRQGMSGSLKAHYDCVAAFSATDFTADLQVIDVPVLVLHGEDDQIVPYANSAPRAAALLRHGVLKGLPGLPHGMAGTHSETVNAEILAFLEA